jgi:hypothetical protein
MEPPPFSGVGVTMSDLLKLPARTANGAVHVIVETPRGARAKLKYEPSLEGFVLSKALMLGLTYPYDWGFIPSTVAEDGDPLDVMIIHEAATSPGLILRCQVIGALLTVQRRGQRNAMIGSWLSQSTHIPNAASTTPVTSPPKPGRSLKNSSLLPMSSKIKS